MEALTGRLQPHQSFLIAEHLAQIDYLEGAIERLSHQIEEKLRPFEQPIGWLDTIPGVNRRTAEVLWAETGGDMSRFASARHLASWAGMCPGNNESAGKRRSGRTRKGSPWLRHCLVEAAHGAAHTKNKYLELAIPPACRSPWQEESPGGGGPLDSGDYVSSANSQTSLCRSGC